jgi:modulator of FtsH protease HflC
MKRGCFSAVLLAAIFLGLLVLTGAFYTVSETEQIIVTQFGKPVGGPVLKPGLHFKLPFIQTVNRLEKRFLEWDGEPIGIPTKDKTYIHVDTFGRWRIKEPLTFFLRLRDERSAQSRLEDILGSETRNSVAKHNLIELVRTDKDREPRRDETLKLASGGTGTIGALPPIRFGKEVIEKEIQVAAADKLKEFGIELLDLRVKRVNYNPDVLDRIYQRMKSERLQIAERFRSEGEGEAARIAGQKERDMNEIQSTAYREFQKIRGEADAKATEIYARAYTQNAQAAEFYEFMKTMETYLTIFSRDSTLMLSTDSELFKLLKRVAPTPAAAPKPATTQPVPTQPVPPAVQPTPALEAPAP